jgi:RecB family exonuclease
MAVRALTRLIEHLQSANVVSVEMERYIDGQFAGGAMNGSIDLLATKANGQDAVIDIKWGGLSYRRDSLQESKYLQLGLYAQLAHHAQKRWPALGYYIIRDSRLLMLNDDFFPDASVIQPDNDESHLEFWQRVVATWEWRRQQIERGLIEVPISDTEPDDDSTPGEQGLEMPEIFDRFDDYGVLTGWSDDA